MKPITVFILVLICRSVCAEDRPLTAEEKGAWWAQFREAQAEAREIEFRQLMFRVLGNKLRRSWECIKDPDTLPDRREKATEELDQIIKKLKLMAETESLLEAARIASATKREMKELLKTKRAEQTPEAF